MFVKETLYTLNDVTVIPAPVTDVKSRQECDPFYKNGKKLPLFVAPMTSVIDDDNTACFQDCGLNVVSSRDDETLSYDDRKARWEKLMNQGCFAGLSMKEFERYFIKEQRSKERQYRVCIDLANGHMQSLLALCKLAKDYYGDRLVLMAGNIANPAAYKEYAKAGVDYVRIGIGSGSVCTTAANSSIHYPMASLIDECKQVKNDIEIALEQSGIYRDCEYRSAPKIVADGGFTNYDQIIKALALGADYCMCGKLFAQCIEACSEVIADKDPGLAGEEEDSISKKPRAVKHPYKKAGVILDLMARGCQFVRIYYGMSTKRAQKEMGGNGGKTAEGILTKVPVKYTVSGWTDNFKSYLKSAMSYTGFRSIEDFIGGPLCKVQSANAYAAYFK